MSLVFIPYSAYSHKQGHIISKNWMPQCWVNNKQHSGLTLSEIKSKIRKEYHDLDEKLVSSQIR